MEHLDKSELRRLFQVAYHHNRFHHLALVVALWHGARVSEVLELTNKSIWDGKISIERKKGSNSTCQSIHIDADPLFDESPILKMKGRLFPFSRQRVDQFIKKYGIMAGIHPNKLHAHALKHSCAMILWDATKSLGQVQGYLGHKAASSTMCYLAESDKNKAEQAIAGIQI